jgi:RNA polymerase sigma-32 factor
MDVDNQISVMERQDLLKKKLKEFRETLSGKQRDIFDNRILTDHPATLQELGDKYHISRERIRQIQEKILNKAKEWLTENIPDFEENYQDLFYE